MSDRKLDDLLNLACNLDWITPLWAILKDVAHDGPVAHLGISAYGGFDRGDIRRLLSKNGVESWGYVYNVAGDLIIFSVAKERAAYAYELLLGSNGTVVYNEAVGADRPVVALSNDVAMKPMTIVPAPSIWGLLKRLIG